MSIEIIKIVSDGDLQLAWAIRKQVFVIEQQVDEAEEFEFEEESTHFLAIQEGKPVGTARWRRTNNGIKLERFAILEAYRSRGVGSALVQSILSDLPIEGGKVYLHAQITAMGLYSKHGFSAIGDEFEEANIKHYKMVLSK